MFFTGNHMSWYNEWGIYLQQNSSVTPSLKPTPRSQTSKNFLLLLDAGIFLVGTNQKSPFNPGKSGGWIGEMWGLQVSAAHPWLSDFCGERQQDFGQMTHYPHNGTRGLAKHLHIESYNGCNWSSGPIYQANEYICNGVTCKKLKSLELLYRCRAFHGTPWDWAPRQGVHFCRTADEYKPTSIANFVFKSSVVSKHTGIDMHDYFM